MTEYDTSAFALPGNPEALDGRSDSMTTVSMSFDPLSGEPGTSERTDFEGTWDRGTLRGSHVDLHGFRHYFRVTSRDLVRLTLGWVPDGRGNATRFSVQGRCLARDADLMLSRVAETCREHAAAMEAGYSRIGRELRRVAGDALPGQGIPPAPDSHAAPASRDEGDRTTPNPLGHAQPEVTHDFPAGRYWVVDPCMALGHDAYDGYLEAGGHGSAGFEYRGRHTCVAGTEHGDGTYGCDLGEVSVESGRVAVMDERTVDELPELGLSGFMVEAGAGMRVEFSRGRLDIGIHGRDGTDWHRIGEPTQDDEEDEEDEGEEDEG